ncbi:hypothetical protein CDV31_010050 [Fusarium ambrosium]|uniref:Aminoglycoside phosphotransferase domain-containing protein n=1 Tax=Fusarium ambrosium TaxID=131363 RepID=A0A428TQY0_9HYPO|nr:hypothetical protein CDV31_010050 [Fusarium ambrosium]
MDLSVYSAENAINQFFAVHTCVTRQQCDDYATHLVEGTVRPVAVQGSFSYTLTAGADQSKIIQFRAAGADLDRGILDLARQVHEQVVPPYTFHGLLCGKIPVYEMEKVSGIPYVKVKPVDPSSDTGPQHYTTVTDLAKFFATSWNGRQHIDPDAIEAIRRDYQARIELLSRYLPDRFQKNLRMVREGLSLLFDKLYPFTLNHGDLSGLNVFVDPDTGHITGILDWPEATICPFGISLWGLENFLGFMDGRGWHYYPNCDNLRSVFWQTFELATGTLSHDEKHRIQIARMAGLCLRYGFTWANGSQERVEEGTIAFRYLDAFCATGD